MSSNSVWSFSLTSSFDDDASGEDETCNIEPEHERIEDLDLSSRVEAVSYKPNPFSIAKINAAARSRMVPSAESTSVQNIPLEKTPVRQRHDIREAFSRQTRRLHGDIGLRQPRESARKLDATVLDDLVCLATDVSGEFSESTHVCPGRDVFTDGPTTASPRRGLESELFSENIAATEETAKAHIYSDVSAFQDVSARPAIVIPHSDSQNPVCRRHGVKTPPTLHSRPLASCGGRLTVPPTFVPPATMNRARRIRFSSPIFGRLPERNTIPSRPKSTQLSSASYSHPDYQSISVPLQNRVSYWPDVNQDSVSLNSVTTYPYHATSPIVPASASHPLAQPGDDIDLPSDDTLVASPTLNSIVPCSNRIVETGPPEPAMQIRSPLVHRDSDESWTTLPQGKKAKASVTKGASKSTGAFRLPGVTWNSRKLGVSPTSNRRVITFLPPPLQNEPTMATASHSPLGTVHTGTAELPTSPTSINHDRDARVSVNIDAIARRYPKMKTLKRN